jgi:hypothetical protein
VRVHKDVQEGHSCPSGGECLYRILKGPDKGKLTVGGSEVGSHVLLAVEIIREYHLFEGIPGGPAGRLD